MINMKSKQKKVLFTIKSIELDEDSEKTTEGKEPIVLQTTKSAADSYDLKSQDLFQKADGNSQSKSLSVSGEFIYSFSNDQEIFNSDSQSQQKKSASEQDLFNKSHQKLFTKYTSKYQENSTQSMKKDKQLIINKLQNKAQQLKINQKATEKESGSFASQNKLEENFQKAMKSSSISASQLQLQDKSTKDQKDKKLQEHYKRIKVLFMLEEHINKQMLKSNNVMQYKKLTEKLQRVKEEQGQLQNEIKLLQNEKISQNSGRSSARDIIQSQSLNLNTELKLEQPKQNISKLERIIYDYQLVFIFIGFFILCLFGIVQIQQFSFLVSLSEDQIIK